MALGFSVPELVAAARGGGALRMGLSGVAEADWLQPAFDAAVRRDAFARGDAVIALPEAMAAGEEVAAMLGIAGGLDGAASSRWEDMCLLQPDADGAYVLTAGAVAFPTDWRLADKIGRPLTAIHAPIHGYAEQLAAGVDHFFGALRPGPIFGRANWFVVADGDWRYMPTGEPEARFAHVSMDNAGETLFVRCERQTIRRLSGSGAVLFTIGVAVERMGALPADTVRRVAASVAAIPGGERKRRAAPHYADALIAYATALETREAA